MRDPRDLSFAANGALTMFCDGAAVGYRIEGRSAGEAWRFEVDSKSGGVVETPNRNRFVTTNRAFHEVSPSGGIAFHGRLAGGWTAVRTEYLDAEMAVKLC